MEGLCEKNSLRQQRTWTRCSIRAGGNGVVFKARLPKGQVVAVKKLDQFENEELKDGTIFRNEIQGFTYIWL